MGYVRALAEPSGLPVLSEGSPITIEHLPNDEKVGHPKAGVPPHEFARPGQAHAFEGFGFRCETSRPVVSEGQSPAVGADGARAAQALGSESGAAHFPDVPPETELHLEAQTVIEYKTCDRNTTLDDDEAPVHGGSSSGLLRHPDLASSYALLLSFTTATAPAIRSPTHRRNYASLRASRDSERAGVVIARLRGNGRMTGHLKRREPTRP